ncbi:MAG TPA: anthranilate phosphoribosyltransferase [Armatimonadota bacterium]|jgi:anthranilate phosphoribosyltransferase
MIQHALHALAAGEHLSRQQAYETLTEIMDGAATETQIGALLMALRMKGEQPVEMAGFAQAMREHALRVPVDADGLVDTCGTGGDCLGTFNISTLAAFVAAGAGARVAKHGNRAASSKCGSADVLRELGLNVELGPEQVAECLRQAGIGFLFAQRLHPAMRHAAGPRRELGMRTVFNLLGPLANPAGASRQLLGVYSPEAARLLAAALADLGCEHALVVHGLDGLDEISTTGPTLILEVRGGQVAESEVTPEQFGLPRVSIADLAGGDPASCAVIATALLAGERGPARDIVLLNAAAALYVSGLAPSLSAGLPLAVASLDSGAARGKLEQLRRLSQELATADVHT